MGDWGCTVAAAVREGVLGGGVRGAESEVGLIGRGARKGAKSEV